jgi:hypothetical protein
VRWSDQGSKPGAALALGLLHGRRHQSSRGWLGVGGPVHAGLVDVHQCTALIGRRQHHLGRRPPKSSASARSDSSGPARTTQAVPFLQPRDHGNRTPVPCRGAEGKLFSVRRRGAETHGRGCCERRARGHGQRQLAAETGHGRVVVGVRRTRTAPAIPVRPRRPFAQHTFPSASVAPEWEPVTGLAATT